MVAQLNGARSDLLVLVAAVIAWLTLILRIPPEARDPGYYLNGAVLLVCLALLAERPR